MKIAPAEELGNRQFPKIGNLQVSEMENPRDLSQGIPISPEAQMPPRAEEAHGREEILKTGVAENSVKEPKALRASRESPEETDRKAQASKGKVPTGALAAIASPRRVQEREIPDSRALIKKKIKALKAQKETTTSPEQRDRAVTPKVKRVIEALKEKTSKALEALKETMTSPEQGDRAVMLKVKPDSGARNARLSQEPEVLGIPEVASRRRAPVHRTEDLITNVFGKMPLRKSRHKQKIAWSKIWNGKTG